MLCEGHPDDDNSIAADMPAGQAHYCDGSCRRGEGIEPDTVYVIVDEHGRETGQFGRTPDGVGMIWYDSEAALLEDTGLTEFDTVELTDHELLILRGEA